MNTIWRDPDIETFDYPGLVVHDGRHSGSITVGQSRLPLNAIIPDMMTHVDWSELSEQWSLGTVSGDLTRDDFSEFLWSLLEVRGEFARLLCVLADVERFAETTENDDVPWWMDEPSRDRVIAALRYCLSALEASA